MHTQVGFNRVPEKIPEKVADKVPEEVLRKKCKNKTLRQLGYHRSLFFKYIFFTPIYLFLGCIPIPGLFVLGYILRSDIRWFVTS